MNNIFISYRRADSADVVGRIYEHLKGIVGADNIFKDVHSVQLGIDYLKFTADILKKCDVQLAIIGREWLNGRRIDNPDDLVRVEIETAMQRDIPVIPVLVGGAEMPSQDELPDSLKPLAYRNAIRVRPDPDFPTDMARLVSALERIISIEPQGKKQNRSSIPKWVPWFAGVLIAAGVLAWFTFSGGKEETPLISGSGADSTVVPGGDAAAKVERAMEFVDQYNSTGQLLDSRTRVSEATANGMDSLASVLKDTTLNEQELAAAYNNTILNLVKEENLGASLEQLFNFYEQQLICRDMQLCDDEVVAGFIDNEAGGFSRTFYPWVCQVRSDWNNPGTYGRVLDFYLKDASAKVCG